MEDRLILGGWNFIPREFSFHIIQRRLVASFLFHVMRAKLDENMKLSVYLKIYQILVVDRIVSDTAM